MDELTKHYYESKISKLERQVGHYAQQCILLINMLSQLCHCYPHVFQECISTKKVKEIRCHDE